jgi:hypothetical protein
MVKRKPTPAPAKVANEETEMAGMFGNTGPAVAHRIRQIENELRLFVEALRRYAPGTPEHRHCQDRVHELQRDLARARMGKIVASD